MIKELEARIKEIIPRTYNVISFRAEASAGADFKAGQFMEVSLKTKPVLKRYLSISSSPTEKGYLEFTKKITQSDFCKALQNLKPGDFLNLRYPLGKFTLSGGEKKIAFLSGGIGITPIRSIVKFIVDTKLGLDMVLFYANRSAKDIAFWEDFEDMQRSYAKLKVIHVISEFSQGLTGCKSGMINAEMIRECLSDYAERKFYLCGPPVMVSAMQAILSKELSLPYSQVITENFQGY